MRNRKYFHGFLIFHTDFKVAMLYLISIVSAYLNTCIGSTIKVTSDKHVKLKSLFPLFIKMGVI